MNNEKLIREYNELSTLKESNPEEFAERSAKLLEELEPYTDRIKSDLLPEWDHLAEVAGKLNLAGGLFYVRKDPEWRRELLEYVTVGPYIWAEGGHIYYAFITADIIDGSTRERLKRRAVFTKDWVSTNITPLKNSIARLKEEVEKVPNSVVRLKEEAEKAPKIIALLKEYVEKTQNKTYRYKVELTDAGPNKVKAIKIVRQLMGLGLKECKDFVDTVPSILMETDSKEEADNCKTMFDGIDAKVTIWDENERREV